MAFPVVQSVTPTNTSGTSHAIAMPGTVSSGDLLLMIVIASGASISGTPSGWTAVANLTQIPIYARVSNGSEGGGTATISTGSSVSIAAQVYRISGWHGSISTGIEVATSQGGNTSSVNPPPLNPVNWGVDDTLWIAVARWIHSSFAVSSYPTSYTNGTATTGGSARLATARRNQAVETGDPGSFSLSGIVSGPIGTTIAIRPVKINSLSGTAQVSMSPEGAINAVHQLDGSTQTGIQGQGQISGGLAELAGSAPVEIEGTGLVSQEHLFSGAAGLAVEGAGGVVISDYNFRWSIDFLEARSDHGYPTVYAEVSSEAMPSGAFPEGAFFERRLLEMPRLEEAEFGERFGITGFQRVTLTLDNSDGLISSLELTDAYVRLFFVSEAGDVREWKGRVTEWTLSHRCVVSVEDMDAVALTEELPRRTLNDIVEAEKEADSGFEDVVVANDLGRPVPIIFGRAVKVPLLYIKADEAAREYDYIIGEGEGLGGGNFTEVFTVYREDQALDDIEGDVASATSTTLTLEAGDRRPDGWYRYWWVQITAGTGAGQIRHVTAYDSTLNRITVNSSWSPTPNSGSDYRLREWRFFDGSQVAPYAGLAFVRFKKRLGVSGSTDAIYADVNGFTTETNVVRAVESLLSDAVWGLGLDVDAGSFDTAAALPEISDISCEGAIIDTTTITDILNGSGESQGLLSFRDMVLSKTDAVTITVDAPKSPAHSFGLGDETGWNNILTASPEITHLHSGERVKNLKVRYRKNNKESDLYLHELERGSGASGVDRALTLPFVHGHETADRWLDYRRKRLAAAVRRMAIEAGQEGGSVRRGERVTVSVPTLGLEGSAWEVAGCGVTPAGSNSLSLIPYSAAPYTYVPLTDEGGELPSDEFFDIAPDYTKTPPDPVSSVSVSYTNDLSPEGQRQTFAVVTFAPPEDNFDHAVVSIRKNGAPNWESAGSGTNRVRVPVTAGFFMDYLIVPYNVHGLAGLAATISNNLVPGDSTAPGPVSGLTGSVKLGAGEWFWNPNTEPDLSGYDYEIRTASSAAGAAGNGSVVPRGSGTDIDVNRVQFNMRDTNNLEFLTTSVTRHCRVRARDLSGNVGLWSATFPLSSGDVERMDARNEDFNMPRSYENDGAIPIDGGSWVEIGSVTATVVTSQRVFIHGAFRYLKSGVGLGSYWYRITRTFNAVTTTVYGEGNPSGFGILTNQSQPVSFSFSNTPPGEGNVTYRMYAAGGNGDQASFRRMAINQMKR